MGDSTTSFTGIPETFSAEINKAKESLLTETNTQTAQVKQELEDLTGPIKRLS